jgi:hemolysin III
MKLRLETGREEVANALSHGVGLVASLAALPVLVMLALQRGDAWKVVGTIVFGVSLVTLYTASTVYHALPSTSRAKQIWRRIDHAAVYFLIAGTYTPFTLGPLRGPWGWSLFGVVWGIALIGMMKDLCVGPRWQTLSTIVYLALGWLVVIALAPLLQRVGPTGLAWLFAGGIAYTIGVIFFACDQRMRGAHCLWHVFVLIGSVCHAVAVVGFA